MLNDAELPAPSLMFMISPVAGELGKVTAVVAGVPLLITTYLSVERTVTAPAIVITRTLLISAPDSVVVPEIIVLDDAFKVVNEPAAATVPPIAGGDAR